MSVKPITDSLPLSCKGEETILLKQIAQNTQSAAQAARQQLLLSKIRLGLTGFLTALVLLAFLLWGPRLHRSLQNADHAFDSCLSAGTGGHPRPALGYGSAGR